MFRSGALECYYVTVIAYRVRRKYASSEALALGAWSSEEFSIQIMYLFFDFPIRIPSSPEPQQKCFIFQVGIK